MDKKIKSVRETVWPWNAAERGVAGASLARRLIIQLAVMSAVALVFFLLGGRRMALVVLVVAGLFAGTALTAPKAYEVIEGFLRRLGVWAGVGITWMLLVPFFYLCFVAARLLLRLAGKDPMRLAFPSPQTTCWENRESPTTREGYKRQY